ncbi:MAG: hypothetical protein JXR51_07675 [Bacteroidales bacterium]|nr:hypothetical protein [Bacteroidales bacterium]MBN2757038.1 hypothetical protein [Bacteroidales bacterium]
MKTIDIKKWRILVIVVLFQLFLFENTISQCKPKIKKELGISTNVIASCSGHGILSTFNILLKFDNNEIDAGVIIQDEYLSFSGINLKYKYLINSALYTKLYFHYTFNYHINSALSSRLNKIYHPEDYNTIDELETFRTFENYLGLGLQTQISRKLFFDTSIGFGGYFSAVQGDDLRCTSSFCREDDAFSIMASIGIKYKFEIKDKKINWDF